MANTPCQIVVFYNEKADPRCNMKHLLAVCKHLFRVGVKTIKAWGKKEVLVSLQYSPRNITLQQKFQNMPISWVRLSLEGEEEVNTFVEAIQLFKVNILESVKEPEDELRNVLLHREQPNTVVAAAAATAAAATSSHPAIQQQQQQQRTSTASTTNMLQQKMRQVYLVTSQQQQQQQPSSVKTPVNSNPEEDEEEEEEEVAAPRRKKVRTVPIEDDLEEGEYLFNL